MNNVQRAIQNLQFGIEIETKNISRRKAVQMIGMAVRNTGGTFRLDTDGGYYDKQVCILADGRKWTAMSDASIGEGNSEIVSPICTLEDMDLVQEIVRCLRRGGATVDSDCGIHVHVDAARMDGPALGRLAAITYQYEPLMKEALGVASSREHWAKDITESKAKALRKARTTDQAARAWYGHDNWERDARIHYDNSRYAGLNLHSTFYRGTIEFRYFDSTLHAGKVRSYVMLCLSLVEFARNTKQAAVRRVKYRLQDNKKWTMYCFLYYKLGLKGEENKNVRNHLISKLSGDLPGGRRNRVAA